MIKVGFDISQAFHSGGVGIYTDNLSKELIKFKTLDMVFFYSLLRRRYRGSLPKVKSFPIPPTILEPLFNKVRMPIEPFIGEVDIFHSSDWMQPKTKAKKVTTYHDIVPIKYPQWSHPKVVEVNKRRLRIVEKEIDLVIAVSNATKKDLLEVTNIPEDKITVIYEGVDHQEFKLFSAEEILKFKIVTNLPDRFILSIGGIGERRNLTRVKKACDELNYHLVITGETIPWVKSQDLPLLYNAAEALLYPSFYEGFGLPILEAMACGTPVVTSNVSSMPEVGGEGVEYVNPESIDEIKRKLKEVMEDQQKRNIMVKKGIERSKQFTWQKCAEETAEVYRGLYKS